MSLHTCAGTGVWPPMTAASSVADFLARPIGRYWAGSCHVHWSYSPQLAGSIIWGYPGEDDVRAIVRLWDFGRSLPLPDGGLDIITDCRFLERIDAETFSLVLAYAAERQPEFARRYRRQALVPPARPTAATMAGGFSLLGKTHAGDLFQPPDPPLPRAGPAAPG